MNESIFAILNAVNVNDHTEKKNGLTYLSWAWAWGELLKRFPDATYTVYENKDGWCYHTDGRTCWVKTGVTIQGKEYIEMLPVMDFRNKSIPLEQVTSTDVNKAIQRSLTKAVARHGLGLYIYAGEDLPEEDRPKQPDPPKPSRVEIVKAFCAKNNLSTSQFGAYRNMLVSTGGIPDKKVNDLSDTEFDILMGFVEMNLSQPA